MHYHILYDHFNDITVYTTSPAYARKLAEEYALKPIVSVNGYDLSTYYFHGLRNNPEEITSATYYFQKIRNNEIKPPIEYLNLKKEKNNEKINDNTKYIKQFKL